MNNTSSTILHNNSLNTFENLRFRAVVENLSARFLGKDMKLKSFAQQAFKITSQRIYLGEQKISLDQITGSVSREKDFDNQFRPLKPHLRERWNEVFALFKAGQLPPIELFKVGSDYYVKDGHYRLSVARATGKLSLRAKVWEIPLQSKEDDCVLCLPKSKNNRKVVAHA